jgi:hypothetical protein
MRKEECEDLAAGRYAVERGKKRFTTTDTNWDKDSFCLGCG